MSITSYAQNFEDVVLWRALGSVAAGTYIDIGAQDPISDSVSRGFYERGWRGVHVEPSAQYSDMLRKDRPDELVIQAAISSTPDLVKFYEVNDTGLSTVVEDVAAVIHDHGFSASEKLVCAITMDQLFDNISSADIHWLKIDVEGHERAVLESWKESSRRPWVVVIEAVRPWTREESHHEWEHLMLEKGYDFAYFDGLNRFYVSAAHSELRQSFTLGPSFWDEMQLPESARPVRDLLLRHASTCSNIWAEAAEKVEAVSTALAAAESGREALSADLCAVQGALSTARGELSQMQGAVAHLSEALEQSGRELGLTRQQLGQQDSELSNVRDALDRTVRERDGARGELSQMLGAVAHLSEALEQSGRELGLTRQQLSQQDIELSNVRDALDRTVRERDGARGELSQMLGAVAHLSEALEQSGRELGLTRQQLSQQDIELSDVRDALDRTVREREGVRLECVRAREVCDQLEIERANLRAALDQSGSDLEGAWREIEAAAAAGGRMRIELVSAHDASEKIRRELHETRAQLSSKDEDLALLRKAVEVERSEFAAVRQITHDRLNWSNTKLAELEVGVDQIYAALEDNGLELGEAREDLSTANCRLDQTAQQLSQTSKKLVITQLELAESQDLLHEREWRLRASESLAQDLQKALDAVKVERGGLGVVRKMISRRSSTPSAALQPNAKEPHQAADAYEQLLSLPDAAFITRLYQLLLGREPDADGFEAYSAQLSDGVGRIEVITAIRCSPEGQRRPGIPEIEDHISLPRDDALGRLARAVKYLRQRVGQARPSTKLAHRGDASGEASPSTLSAAPAIHPKTQDLGSLGGS